MRFFNTAGPVKCQIHYCVPPLQRFDLDMVMMLIAQQKYCVLHAPRQVGKTTYLLALMEHLNQTGQYTALYINVEIAQAAREDVDAAIRAILSELGSAARVYLGDQTLEALWPAIWREHGGFNALGEVLTRWADGNAKPLVLLIDEIDALIGDTLIAVLRQLRAGYAKRPWLFPQSVVLCGVRDVRDYRIHSSRNQEIITGGSAFNIKARSLRMDDFDKAEVQSLYRQHTAETGQPFDAEALELMWQLTQGQPWLVNALGYEVCFEMAAGRERSHPITVNLVNEAKEHLILRRETHLDQLVDKLREPRVRSVIEPILAGQRTPERLPDDDVQYVVDLGLVAKDGQLHIANPIYQEIIPRALIYTTQLTISQEPAWYIQPDGRLDVAKLLAAFQQFYREHSEHWLAGMPYREAGPQLLMQAFLQRIVNGGGRVEREYGLGRRRTDLLLIWPYPGGVQRVVIELKVRYGVLEQVLADGQAQVWAYMDSSGAEAGHLLIFDREPGRSWDEKIYRRTVQYRGKSIEVWGM
ncbi:MAG TPA: ATP-binding protein [Anaerolineae bacterium]|nr:ATP-binding protein [Anaerolineae bacterium]